MDLGQGSVVTGPPRLWSGFHLFIPGFVRLSRLGNVHCLETPLDEPFLVVAPVGGEGATQDEQFHLVRRMSHSRQGFQARSHLGVRVKIVFQGPHGSRLIRQVGFWHAHIVRAKDALPGTGIGLGQHRDGGHAGQGPHRFQADGCQQSLICFPLAGFDQLVVGRHQGGFMERGFIPGVVPQSSFHCLALAHIFQSMDCLGHLLGGQGAHIAPVLFLYHG